MFFDILPGRRPAQSKRVPGWIVYSYPLDIVINRIVDLSHCGVEWETAELGPEREIFVVAVAEVCEDTRSRIRDREMVEGAEKEHGGHCRELPQPVYNHHLVIADDNATDEDIETSCNEAGVEAREFGLCYEVFQC